MPLYMLLFLVLSLILFFKYKKMEFIKNNTLLRMGVVSKLGKGIYAQKPTHKSQFFGGRLLLHSLG